MHQESQQITELWVFDQQIFTRGLLQRNNFPLHFLSWTKTPLKWMAFAHSLWPQLAALLASLVLWPLNRQAADEGRQRGLTQQVLKHIKPLQLLSSLRRNTSISLSKGLVELFIFVLIFWKAWAKRMFDSPLKSTAGHWSLIEVYKNRLLRLYLQKTHWACYRFYFRFFLFQNLFKKFCCDCGEF